MLRSAQCAFSCVLVLQKFPKFLCSYVYLLLPIFFTERDFELVKQRDTQHFPYPIPLLLLSTCSFVEK